MSGCCSLSAIWCSVAVCCHRTAPWARTCAGGNTRAPHPRCRAKGLTQVGSFKAGTIAKLAYIKTIQSIDLTSRDTCGQGNCTILIGLECLPEKTSQKCAADANGNIGNSNHGSDNYGNSNIGNNNIGALGGRFHGTPSTTSKNACSCAWHTPWPESVKVPLSPRAQVS